MAFDIAIKSFDYSGNEDRTWLATRKGFDTCRSVTLDVSAFNAAHLTDKGAIPSGTVLAKITASGLYGPYSGTSDEVQTVTVGGSGLTTFTLTYSGQTTASIAAAATAATVQAALEALSNIAVGDVVVSGDAGGPWTVKFTGTLANTDVAAMTSTPTGGTGTVTIATTTAGGAAGTADGLDVAKGFLFNTTVVGSPTRDGLGSGTDLSTAANVSVPLLWEGVILESQLPTFVLGVDDGQLDAAAKTDLTHCVFE